MKLAGAWLRRVARSRHADRLILRGSLLTSGQVAERIGKLRDASAALTLAVGGDEGLDARVREQARFVWSLSPLTLPHRLARVLALEQIYRAFEILRGGPYHK